MVTLKPPAKKKYELYLNMATDVSRDGSENKRKLDEDEDEDEGGWVGPLPNEATQTKKKKGDVTLT